MGNRKQAVRTVEKEAQVSSGLVLLSLVPASPSIEALLSDIMARYNRDGRTIMSKWNGGFPPRQVTSTVSQLAGPVWLNAKVNACVELGDRRARRSPSRNKSTEEGERRRSEEVGRRRAEEEGIAPFLWSLGCKGEGQEAGRREGARARGDSGREEGKGARGRFDG